MAAARVIGIIVGLLIILGALPLLFGGGALMWVHYALTDDAGFIKSGTINIERDSYAVVTAYTEIDAEPSAMWLPSNVVTFKVEASNRDATRDVFIGIAAKPALDAYLDDVKYDEASELSAFPYDVTYITHNGNSSPSSPAAESFWRDSVYGSGTQTLEWDIASGVYSLVIMNADGSAGLDLDVVLGVKAPMILAVGAGLLIGGVLMLVLGIAILVFAWRSKNGPRTGVPKHVITEE